MTILDFVGMRRDQFAGRLIAHPNCLPQWRESLLIFSSLDLLPERLGSKLTYRAQFSLRLHRCQLTMIFSSSKYDTRNRTCDSESHPGPEG